ncbi:MAG: aldo/keto reductase [Fimbriimonadaceae bacterium]
MDLTRRDFVKAAAATAATVAAASTVAQTANPTVSPLPGSMPVRPFGKTGWRASIYGLGTAEVSGGDDTVRAIRAAVAGGVNYIDTAPSYVGTRSETAVGRALEGGLRERVFLATKTLRRDADGAYQEVRESLNRLKTNRIDLLQIHSVNDMGTLDQALRKGGAVEGLERARREGLIRWIGISGHTRPDVIGAAIDRYPFDSILVAVSAVDTHINDFAAEVVPAARKKGIAVVGMKALKGMERAQGAKMEVEPLLRYAWSLPVDTVIVGLRHESEIRPNLVAARTFRPMPPAEMRALEARLKPFADVGHLWWKRG